ncbi:MAG: BrnT family toxin [Beijerinckiaceae bacterium]|nr:BrnT family toxin [Beijerinckiaceae bacterium]
MGFQWDIEKSLNNEAKHGISFLQAAQIFRKTILKAEDRRRDYGESRFIALGEFDGEILSVVFTERDGDVRIISAWKAGKHERERYRKTVQSGQV